MTDNRIASWRKLAHSIASRSASPRALTDAEAALVIALREAADRCEEREKHVTGLEEMSRLSADCVKRAEEACVTLNGQRNALETQVANYQAFVEADQAFGKLMAEKCDKLEARLALAEACLEAVFTPGTVTERQQAAYEAWLAAKGDSK